MLLGPSRRALAAQDPYAAVKPLVGTWLVDIDCVVSRDKFLFVVIREPKQLFAQFRRPDSADDVLFTADIMYKGVEDHYQVNAAVPALKTLGLLSLPMSLVVSDDDEDPDSPGRDYLTFSSHLPAFDSQGTVKLRDRYRKATLIFKAKSALGDNQCRGTMVKQKPARKQKQPQ